MFLVFIPVMEGVAAIDENTLEEQQETHYNNELERLSLLEGVEKAKGLLRLSEKQLHSNPVQSAELATKALDILNQAAEPNETAKAYHGLLSAYKQLAQKDAISETILQAIEHAEINGLLDERAILFNEQARFYWQQSNYEQALNSLKQALNDFQQLGNQVKIATIYNNIGIIYRNFGDYEQSLAAYSKALSLRKEIGDLEKVALTLNNIGVLYKEFDFDQEALGVLLQAVALFEQLDLPESLADPLNNIGLVYEKMGQFELALNYLEKSMAIERKINNERGIAYSLNNLGAVYRKMNLLDVSLRQLSKALELAIKMGEKSLIARVHRELAQSHLALNNYTEATSHIQLAVQNAEEIKDKEQQKLNYRLLATILAASENYREAYLAFIQFKQITDKLDSENSHEQFIRFQNRLEIEQRENQIALLKKQNEINMLDMQKRNATRNFAIISSIGLLIIITLLYIRYLNRRSLQKERSLNKKLTHLDMLKSQFLANTSHELLTPLNGIIGLAEVLQIEESDFEKKENIALISASGRQLEKIVHNILELSNLTHRDIALELVSINLYHICNEVIDLFAPLATEKKIDLKLKSRDKKLVIFADEIRLRQIFYHLLNNAIKFSERGEVSVNYWAEAGEIIIQVSDSGIGIPKNKIARVFESFEQVDGANNRAIGGAGIGLAISKKLVELHHGRIWVESIEKQGSNFFVALPSRSSV